MAVKIRLKRIGMKRTPHYRIVVSDSRSPRDGRFIEELGIYSPKTSPMKLKIDLERAKEWIGNGAKPTDTIRRLIKVYEAMSEEEREASSGRSEAFVATKTVTDSKKAGETANVHSEDAPAEEKAAPEMSAGSEEEFDTALEPSREASEDRSEEDTEEIS